MVKKFGLKLTFENEPLIKAKAEKLEDFDPIIKTLKKKFGGSK